MAKGLTALEAKVLDLLLAGDLDVLRTLRQQLDVASVSQREWTGVGFFTYLDVPSGCVPVSSPANFTISDVSGTLSGVECGSVLFVNNGRLAMLECHTWGVGVVSEGVVLDELHYLRRGKRSELIATAERDVAALMAEWNPGTSS